jgi:hypothetical protein
MQATQTNTTSVELTTEKPQSRQVRRQMERIIAKNTRQYRNEQILKLNKRRGLY